jgi:hypothetical protein
MNQMFSTSNDRHTFYGFEARWGEFGSDVTKVIKIFCLHFRFIKIKLLNNNLIKINFK